MEDQVKVEKVNLSESTPFELNPSLARVKAKELYILGNYKAKEISDILGIPESTVSHWIHNSCNGGVGWKREKEAFYGKTIEKVKTEKGEILEEVLGLSIDIIHRGLLNLSSRSEFSLAELRKVSDIIEATNKGLLLEQGKPTEITASFKGTQEELDKLLNELSEVDEFQVYKKEVH